MSKKLDLLIIDPQDSFCATVDPAEQQVVHRGELCVPGAWDDFQRVADLIDRLGGKIDDIHVTMDSHHPLHIAHPMWWKAVAVNGLNPGDQPNPFTFVRLEGNDMVGSVFNPTTLGFDDIGTFTTARSGLLNWTQNYLKELEASKRYGHTIWPPHCLIGTPGNNVVQPLFDSFQRWCQKNCGYIDYVTKGSNPKVEHFSGLRAEVIDPSDPEGTGINSRFLTTVMKADVILLAGVAGSHCVANTVRDMANEFFDENDPQNQSDEFIRKVVLLEDAISPVPGFEQQQKDFVADMVKRGMQTTTCADFLA
jgi:nicotinamidase-related amidase